MYDSGIQRNVSIRRMVSAITKDKEAVMGKEAENKTRSSAEGLTVVLLLSAILITIGTISYLYPERVQFAEFCRTMGVVLIVFGLVKIGLYLFRGEYRNITNYDFSIGLIIASLGVSGISAAEQLGENDVQFMGILILVDAVIMIQYALQIRIMDGKMFPFAMVIAVGVYVFALLAIIEPGGIFHINAKLFSILTAVSGVLGLVSMILVWFRSRNLAFEEERDARRILEDEPVANTPEQESIPEIGDTADEQSAEETE